MQGGGSSGKGWCETMTDSEKNLVMSIAKDIIITMIQYYKRTLLKEEIKKVVAEVREAFEELDSKKNSE